jgi:uncharacterized membrane protein
MASRKPARATSGQTKTADSAARSDTTGQARTGRDNRPSTASTKMVSTRTGQAGTPQNGQGRTGQNNRTKTGQDGRTGQNARGQNARGQGARRQGAGRQGAGRQGQDSRGRNAAGAAQGRATATQARTSAATAAPPAGSTAPPLWFQITTLVLSLGGLGMSVYLTIAHYTSTSILACSDNGYVNCAKVTTSSESILFGVFPVAVLGLAFYVFMVGINTPWAWRWQHPLIPWVRTGGIISGIAFVLYLIYAEVIEIGNLCLLCTTVHIITFLLFLLLMSVAPFLSKPKAAAR